MYRSIREILLPTRYDKEKYNAYVHQKIINARQAGIDEANNEGVTGYNTKRNKVSEMGDY